MEDGLPICDHQILGGEMSCFFAMRVDFVAQYIDF